MTSSVFGPLAACQALAQRFSDVTGGHARADLQVMPEGGVTLKYLQGCPHSGDPTYEVVYEDQLSLLRAMDSLTTHVARALKANAEGMELASVTLESASATSGVVHVHFYCPAWHHPHSLPCRYEVRDIPNGKHVTLELIGPAYLTTEQAVGWDRMYDAGLVGALSKVLPLASQAIAQLLMLNEACGLQARTVLLPGEHRQYTGHAENGVVLQNFEAQPGFWNVYPKGNVLFVDTPEGRLELPMPKVRELNTALARWQAVCEAVGDAVREEG